MWVQSLGQEDPRKEENLHKYSCLENPMDRGAWWTTVHTGTKSWTQLSALAHRLKRCWEVPAHTQLGKGPFCGLQKLQFKVPTFNSRPQTEIVCSLHHLH